MGDWDREKLQERVAKFKGGVAVVKAGGRTELQMQECRDRIEDAVFAAKAAIDEGVVIGGGCSLLYASLTREFSQFLDALDTDQKLGAQIIKQACEQPIRAICKNSTNLSPGSLVERLKALNSRKLSYDAKTLEIVENSPVIDPVKVVKSSLRYGAGLASIILTAECAVVDEEYDFAKRLHEQIVI